MGSVRVLVRSIIHNTDDFYILSGERRETDTYGSSKITCKGRLFGLEDIVPGIPIELFGKWVRNSKYGWQFDFNGWAPWAASVVGVDNFLHGCFKVLDEFQSASLVDTFGIDTFKVLSEDSNRIAEVPGFDQDLIQRVRTAWVGLLTSSDLSAFLSDHDVTSEQMASLFRTFGVDSKRVISENPYRLLEVDGFPFDKADSVAQANGIELDDPRRFEGAVLWILRESSKSGNLCVRRGDMASQLSEMLKSTEIYPFDVATLSEDLMKATARLEEREGVRVDPEIGVYLPSLYEYERGSARYLVKFITPLKLDVDYKGFLDSYESVHQVKLSEAQQDAVEKLVNNRVLVLTGGPGTGKCVVSDTLISGSFGFREIGSFLPGTLQKGSTFNLIVELDTAQGQCYSEYVYYGGVTKTLHITTDSGFTLEGTPEHPVRVIKEGELVWIELKDLIPGDSVVLVRGSGRYSFGTLTLLPEPEYLHFNETHFHKPFYMTPGLALILGYLTSEGSVVDAGSWSITTYSENVLSELDRTFRDELDFKVCFHYDHRVGQDTGVIIHGKALIRWFRKIGVNPEYADTKSIPKLILESTLDNLVSYLRGLFEGDGSVDTDRFSVEYSTSSEKLAHQLQVVLLALGIVSSCHDCIRGGKPYFRLGIYGEDYDRFRELVGFHLTILPERTRVSNTNKHLIPEVSGLIHQLVRTKKLPRSFHTRFKRYTKSYGSNPRRPSRKTLGDLLSYFSGNDPIVQKLTLLASDQWFYDSVAKVKESTGSVVDFGVPLVHEFISNGFVSHNTTVTRAFVELFERTGVTYALMAPTGIAAKRMASVTGRPAATIHRTFRYNGDTWGYHGFNKYPVGAVVIDECCLPYRQFVDLADGSRRYIGTIVNQRQSVEVLTYNILTGCIEPRKVVNWFKYPHPEEEQLYRIKLSSSDSRSRQRILRCTGKHKVYTSAREKKMASSLKEGDPVLIRSLFFSKEQRSFALGSLLGDANIGGVPSGRRLSFVHCQEQEAYLRFKSDLFRCSKPYQARGGYKPDKFTWCCTSPIIEDLEEDYRVLYPKGKKVPSREWLDQLDPISLAAWYMDDGSLSLPDGSAAVLLNTEGFSDESCYLLSEWLFDKWGFESGVYSNGRGHFYLRLTCASSRSFLTLVAPWIHPSMAYKIPAGIPVGSSLKDLSGNFIEVSDYSVRSINRYTLKENTRKFVYDIEVEGNHNYFSNGVLVSNSMVDQELLFRTLDALEEGTILVFVGDDAQLPSVGPGNVLRELVHCPSIPTVRLTQIFRQAQQSEIILNSHRINRGDSIVIGDDSSDFRFVPILEDTRILELVVKMAQKLKGRDENFQVLSPKHEGTVGVINLNDKLREVLNPPATGKKEVTMGTLRFREGDRLMVIKNDYTLGIYNGDMGKLIAIRSDSLTVRIHGIGEGGVDVQVEIPRNDVVLKLRLAYAITVHKSQGSEFDTVILPMVRNHGRMLQRNLFYTAVTRAKKKVWLLGDRGSIQRAINNAHVIHRNTGFGKAIQDLMSKTE